MKIYLAARYSRYPEMQKYAIDLETLGHEVTSRWITGAHSLELQGDYHRPQPGGFNPHDTEKLRQFAKEDMADLMRASCTISFTEEPKTVLTRGARHTEFGVAWANWHRLIVVGPRENIFHFLPEVDVYDTWEDCFHQLLNENEEFKETRKALQLYV